MCEQQMRIRTDLLPNVAGSKMSARIFRALKSALRTPWWERHLRLINTMRKEISTQDRTLEVDIYDPLSSENDSTVQETSLAASMRWT
jgi:hypothetical protein